MTDEFYIDEKTGERRLSTRREEPIEIDLTDETALRMMARTKLAEIVAAAPSNASALPAIRELLDRLEGKPAQSVSLEATVKQVIVNATIRFADEPKTIENNLLCISKSDD